MCAKTPVCMLNQPRHTNLTKQLNLKNPGLMTGVFIFGRLRLMLNIFSCFSPTPPLLAEQDKQRLTAWQLITPSDVTQPMEQARYVVVDVETSGLNLNRDRLIAIGAVAVKAGEIILNDSFEMVLQQQTASSSDNILVHGIGGSTQTSATPPQEALLHFLEYLGKAPLIAFHATFDETMLCNAFRQFLGLKFQPPWLDLAYVLPGLYPDLPQKFHSLDEWLAYYAIPNYARHNALSDALCTAQLFLIAQTSAQRTNMHHFRDLQNLEKIQRWLKKAT